MPLLFLNGIVVGSFLGPTWSLSAEALYYVAAPILRQMRTDVIAAGVALSAVIYLCHDTIGLPRLPDALYGWAAAAVFWAWGLGFLAYRLRAQVLPALIACAIWVVVLCVLRKWNYEGGNLVWLTLIGPATAIGIDSWPRLGPRACAVLN
jgi:peptidoglycan/LPS O-acetylase OafA/YrhL